MSDWITTRLGDICEVVRGGSPRPIMDFVTNSPDGVNWLKIGDVSEHDKYFTHSAERIKKTGIVNSREVKKGDLILSNSMSFGRVFITLIDGFIHDGWLRLRNNEDVLDREYLYYFLSSDLAQNQFKAVATGSVVNNLKTDTVKAVKIDLPPLAMQRSIAAILSPLDDKIANNTMINHHLEQMAQAIFKSWFMEFEPTKPFTSIVQVLGGGTPQTNNAEYWNGTIPFFTPKDAIATYVLTTEKSLTESGLNNCNSKLYPVNTVFVTARGTVGKLAMAGTPMAMNQSCYALVGNVGYGQYFVYHLALETVESLKHKASGAVFDAIVTRDFESEIVPAPSVESVWAFEEKVVPIYKVILNNLKESARLANLRDAFLPRLISGELSVADIDAK